MSTPTTSGERNPVEALAEEFLDRQRRGERPTLDEYCRRHPGLADEIRDLFPVLIRMEDLGADSSGDATGAAPAGAMERLGDYRILREVGRGGMGVVYEAEQESLGRRVALKLLPDAALGDARQVLRFQREARAAARLHHTNIVPVFGVGREDAHHYYVMQFIPGMGLDAVLEELRRLRRGEGLPTPAPSLKEAGAADVARSILTGRFSPTEGGGAGNGLAPTAAISAPLDGRHAAPPDPGLSSVSLPGASGDSLTGSDPDRTFFGSVANIGRQVAEALEYANRQGVLHRDVKPSNLLLDPRGNVWVADFGLAKATDTDDLTHTGDVVGTVRYMAPERFAGKCDARSDVYALGLTLYELLTLSPAFEASDRHALIQQVMHGEPERMRKLVPHLPRDLETIVAKAIDRDPARRYPTAAAMADDLQRFLDDKPILARRASAAEQAWRWGRRNPSVASLAAGLLLALVVGLIGVTWQWSQAAANLKVAESANRKAQARFGLAMEAVQAFTTGASEDVLLREAQLASLRQKLLTSSLAFYDRLAISLEGETDRASRRSLAQAMFAAAVLNGRVGRREKALEAHRKALALREALVKEAPGDVEAARELGRSELAVGETLAAMGRHAEARPAFDRSRGLAEARIREQPGDPDARLALADGLFAVGSSLYDEFLLADASASLGEAREAYDRLIRTSRTDRPGTTQGRYLHGRAKCSYRIGQLCFEQGRPAESLRGLEEAVVDYTELTRRSPGDVDFWLALAGCHSQMALTMRDYLDNSQPRARREVRQAKAIYRRLARDNPTVTEVRAAWAACLVSDGNTEVNNPAYFDKQLREFEDAVRMFRELVAADPDVPRYVAGLGLGLIRLGGNHQENGRPAEGKARLREAFDLLARTDFTRSTYSFQDGRITQSMATRSLAGSLAMDGHIGEALEVVREGIARDEAYTGARESHWLKKILAECYELRSYLAFAAGLKAEAAAAAERAAALLEPLTDPTAPETWTLAALQMLWYMQGRPASSGRAAESPGRPEHAASALLLLRRAAERGYAPFAVTAAFFGPAMGHMPEYRRLMMDLTLPVDPFQPLPDSPDAEPLPSAAGATP